MPPVTSGSRSTAVGGSTATPPTARFARSSRVPARQSTCCAFGGPGLRRLYVTTATENWTDEQRRAEPAAGLVYRLDTDAIGQPAAPFRPDPAWWSEFSR